MGHGDHDGPAVIIEAAGVSARRLRRIVTEIVDSAAETIIQRMETIMADLADLNAKIDELEAGQVELAKDVRRLLTQGDTAAAIARLDTVISGSAAVDSEVEAVSPEPTAPPADGGTESNV